MGWDEVRVRGSSECIYIEKSINTYNSGRGWRWFEGGGSGIVKGMGLGLL